MLMKLKGRKKRRGMGKALSKRESALLEHIRSGKTITDAARQAGFSPKWPGQAGAQAFRNIKRKMPTILDELGLTVESMIRRACRGALCGTEANRREPNNFADCLVDAATKRRTRLTFSLLVLRYSAQSRLWLGMG